MNPDDPTNCRSASSLSSSLLERIRLRDADAWQRLTALYGPVVYRWARQAGLQGCDASDVVQDVFRAVATNIAGFRRDRTGDSFQGWLWTITKNKIRDHYRRVASQPQAMGGTAAQQRVQQVPDAMLDQSESGTVSPNEIVERAKELVRLELDERTWKAFQRYAVDGAAAADVAKDLGLSVWSVYQAKSRVLRRLRQELADLID